MRSLIHRAALVVALLPQMLHCQEAGPLLFHYTGFGQGGGRQSLTGYFDIPAGTQPDKCHVCLKVGGDDCIARWFADATSTKIRFDFSLPSADYSRAVLVLTDCPLAVKSIDEFNGRPAPFFVRIRVGDFHFDSKPHPP